MEILNTSIEPGKTYQLNLDIARLHTRTKLEIPVIVSRAKIDGPVVLISAGIHGNEINGVEIVRQFVSKKYHIPDRGTIICVPVVNVFGFIIKSRYFPDGKDLNRAFPGAKNGSLASKFAYAFMRKIVRHADYCIDFHTGGAERFNFSHIRLSDDSEEMMRIAKGFGTKFVKCSTLRDRSYREAATKIGKKVFLFEGGKSMNLDRNVTRSGLNGLINVLDLIGVKQKDGDLTVEYTGDEQVVFENSRWIRASESGLYRSMVKNGQYIKRGEAIGSISDPYGFFEKKIKSPINGYIICLNHSPIVNKGDAIAHITMEG